MTTQAKSNAGIRDLSNEDLDAILGRCEKAIAEGSAQIEDYETFVICQKELARRTWS